MSRTNVGNRVRVNFYFDDEMFEALRALARHSQTTYSELIRIACRQYLIAEGQKALTGKNIIEGLVK